VTTDLSQYGLLTIFLVSVAVVLAVSELGRWLGVRVGDREGENIRTLESAVLGLLALMIGFTFAMALSRFEARREAVLSEANAIGTAALRARLLPSPHSAEAQKLLREYVQIKLDLTRSVPSPAQLNSALARSNQIQEALWQQAMIAAAKDNEMVPTGLFIQTLNEMIDNQAKRLAAYTSHVPNIVFLALYGVTAVASAFAGFAAGLGNRSSRLPVYLMGMLVCAMILLIEDLDRPGAGFITVSQQPMLDTAASIATY
jgi:Protein of unknown function (DUF4239)